MISVLCPSRGRPELLVESLSSLGDGDYEYLVYVDEDDPELERYTALENAKLLLYVRPRVGYKNFHLMVNELAADAEGEWILLWNDDALVEGGNVSEAVHQEDPTKPVVLNFFDPEITNMNLFPVISRPLYEAMGHFSLSTHCDSWVQDIANVLKIHKPIPGITVRHRRDLINDRTKEDSQGAYATTSPLYDSDDMISLRLKDQAKIKELL